MRRDDWNIFHRLDIELFDAHDRITEDFFQKRVQKPGFFALETQQGGLVGYLVLGRFTDNIAHLGRIGVQKSKQNKGFGSQLMDYALNWFKNEKDVTEVQLYTQVDNLHAQGLYKKFGFTVIGQTWHYFVSFKTLRPSGQFMLHALQPDEHQQVADLFPTALPIGAIQQFLERKQDLYTLKDSSNRIIGATRFTPSFPGCFPFELLNISAFDDYVQEFQPLCDPPSEVIRITFHENNFVLFLSIRLYCQFYHFMRDISTIERSFVVTCFHEFKC